jgi:hypothetical protein
MGMGTAMGSGSSGGEAVLSQGTRFPCPHSQKIIEPIAVSGRPCVLPHCLQVNQIIESGTRIKNQDNTVVA